MNRRIGVALASLLSVWSLACGGGGAADDDDGTGDIDGNNGGGGDSGTPTDAPPAPVMATLSGVTQTTQGTSTVPLAGVKVEVFARAGGAALATTTSDASGAYSLELDITRGPADVYFKGTSATRLDTYLYPPVAVDRSASGATMLLLNQQTLNLIYTAGGVQAQAGKGFVALAVVDAAGQPMAGATVASMPGTASSIYTTGTTPDRNRRMTDASGAAFLANTNTGDITISASKSGSTFRSVVVNARSGAFTTTAVLAQ
jgi:hypothetical protein